MISNNKIKMTQHKREINGKVLLLKYRKFLQNNLKNSENNCKLLKIFKIMNFRMNSKRLKNNL